MTFGDRDVEFQQEVRRRLTAMFRRELPAPAIFLLTGPVLLLA
jgi:hypothetical protein